MDEAQKGAPAFDYLAGVAAGAEFVVAIEVHPALTKEMKRIVEKKARTKAFLAECGCTCPVERWIWAPTSGVSIRTVTPGRLILAGAGIEWPVSQVDLRTPPRD